TAFGSVRKLSGHLRHGFQAEANGIARQVREELSLAAHAPLDPWLLAALVDVPVIPLTELFAQAPAAVLHFTERGRSVFSAMTVFSGHRRAIVHNDAHVPDRKSVV